MKPVELLYAVTGLVLSALWQKLDDLLQNRMCFCPCWNRSHSSMGQISTFLGPPHLIPSSLDNVVFTANFYHPHAPLMPLTPMPTPMGPSLSSVWLQCLS